MKIDRFIGPKKTPEQRLFFSLGLTTRAIPPERIILRNEARNNDGTEEETTKITIAKINSIIQDSITIEDVDIAHRLKRSPNVRKDIIIRFKLCMTRNRLLRQSKLLRAKGVLVREDLTPVNREVLMSVKRKMSDKLNMSCPRTGSSPTKTQESLFIA
ncbi:hypothetical protein DPMN_051339 [Dreissena polymorpha]|uniref:Uncharacterized protein n=1 Tax=Dreissena polymorpha TaxID=45954 RepID=A0A9D4CJK5_DREPO|nr:hypothetical protein DPMN_051339 [Dreissena polymorpha]